MDTDTQELAQMQQDIADLKEKVSEIHSFIMELKSAIETHPMASMLLG